MAISNTKTVQRIEVYPLADSSADATANAKHPTVMVVYNNTLGGTGADAALDGSVSTQVIHLSKFVEDGGAATDVSGEDALVQTVCGAIWS
tara:strand:- start:1048 stop:1320 length:273 start_codon:yes stop_codon:yes gene_type:complete